MIVKYLLLTLAFSCGIHGANILAFFQHPGFSHFKVFHPIMKGLAEKGHQVTVVSYFPDKSPPTNYKDIVLNISEFSHPEFSMELFTSSTRGFMSNFYEFLELARWGYMTCEKALEPAIINEIIKLHNEKPFDLMITEFFTSDCTLGLTAKLNIPFIGLSSCALFPWHYDRVGIPDTPSYIPSESVRFSQKMDFWQRLENWLAVKITKHLYRIVEFYDNKLIREKISDSIPSLADLKLKTNLILVNQHFSLNGPRPLTPGVIEIGGVHIEEDKAIPEDIKEILDNAKDGVILISMGSILRGDSFPAEKRQTLLNVFKQRKETIIWKWESEELEGKPENVILRKWLPQKEILCHPNVKAFMAHGGLLGITEATYCGVPVIVIPMYGDQFLNAAAIESRGMGIVLNFQDINDKNLEESFKFITTNRMLKKAKSVSKVFKDRPQKPLETAIYWIEYVINNKGGELMRPYSVHMSWYTYYSLDIIGFLFLVIILMTYFFTKIFKFIFRRICKKSYAKLKVN